MIMRRGGGGGTGVKVDADESRRQFKRVLKPNFPARLARVQLAILPHRVATDRIKPSRTLGLFKSKSQTRTI